MKLITCNLLSLPNESYSYGLLFEHPKESLPAFLLLDGDLDLRLLLRVREHLHALPSEIMGFGESKGNLYVYFSDIWAFNQCQTYQYKKNQIPESSEFDKIKRIFNFVENMGIGTPYDTDSWGIELCNTAMLYKEAPKTRDVLREEITNYMNRIVKGCL